MTNTNNGNLILRYIYNVRDEATGARRTRQVFYFTGSKRYTESLAEKIRDHIAAHHNPELADVSAEKIRTWFTSRITSVEYDEQFGMYDFIQPNGFGSVAAQDYVEVHLK